VDQRRVSKGAVRLVRRIMTVAVAVLICGERICDLEVTGNNQSLTLSRILSTFGISFLLFLFSAEIPSLIRNESGSD
jgi:hypothetical protein